MIKYLIVLSIIFSNLLGNNMEKDEYYLVSGSQFIKTDFTKISYVLDKEPKKRPFLGHLYFIYFVDKDKVLLRGSSVRDGTILYDIKNKKVLKQNTNFRVYGYLKDQQLFIARSYHKKEEKSKLYLYDLDFNQIALITDKSSQFSNIILNGSQFIFSKDKEIKNEYWFYDIKTNKKKRLYHLEKNCIGVDNYRSLTNQVICRSSKKKGLILINLFEEKNIEILPFKEGYSSRYYDKDRDILFGNVTEFSFLQMSEISRIEYYDFKSKKFIRVSDEYIPMRHMIKVIK